ncbi:MAG: hypothetical protein F6K04_07550 [Leptolyngbya sp. SIO4C5]|nr:hypothetical protein [Leptolyngbya sp. SIO4C5]
MQASTSDSPAKRHSGLKDFQSRILTKPLGQTLLVALVIALLAAGCSYIGLQLIDPAVWDFQATNTWFEADLSRVFQNMTDHNSDHQRTQVHPLFSLIAFPPTYLLGRFFGLEAQTAVGLVIACVAAFWAAGLFSLLRLVGCRNLDAVLFTLLGGVSAAAMFWFVVPDTYPFSSLTIVMGLLFAAVAEYRPLPAYSYVVVSAITLSVTVTNWMVGILTTLAHHRLRRTVQLSVNAFFLVTLVWGVQKFLFSSAEFFLGSREEQKYVAMASSGGPWRVWQSFIAHTLVMPEIQLRENISSYFNRPDWPTMTTQMSLPGSASLWGAIAVGLWLALLGLGLWSLFSLRTLPKFRWILGSTLVGQLLLHSVYGNETFLYSLNFLPLFLVLVALSTLTRARRMALGLALALIVTAGINNAGQFQQVRALIATHGSPRHQMQAQMQQRPSDPWPRGIGHVILATPGSLEQDKSYHEPGGSFSPSVGSFGVSIWIFDSAGKLKTTSDTMALEQVQQRLISAEAALQPQIETVTESYQTTWSIPQPQTWQLDLQTSSLAPGDRAAIVIRSVGPAGGEITALQWQDQTLKINDRWWAQLDQPPAAVSLGQEGLDDWITGKSTASAWRSEDGWGYARFDLGKGDRWTLTLHDSVPVPPGELQWSGEPSPLKLDLPDRTFVDSLEAQTAHILMGLVNRQPRPGDPINYPLPWLRDGAYEMVALARSGQLEVARQLTDEFAQNDFFGGFGPEADAPGLAIWSLTEIAEQLKDPDYDQWLWPHIYRKVGLITDMLTAQQPIRQPVTAPLVPEVRNDPNRTLVAEAAQNGLIVGRMDHHRPVLYVNAVSYAGLVRAADFAERIGQMELSRQWRSQAEALQTAWHSAFHPPKSHNERTYISGLWPTEIAAQQPDAFRAGLEKRWQQQRDRQGNLLETPLWTYFTVAEAHQWLLLGQPERVWQTLAWFWQHQASPGLYTWWEGEGEENTSGLWQQIYGWVDPPHVTPHYWTAAEMLLLQLDIGQHVEL